MNTHDPRHADDAASQHPDPALSKLRQDVAPSRDLWVGIAGRIANPADAEAIELPAALSSALRELPQAVRPERDLWAGIAARIADPADAAAIELPPALAEALRNQRQDRAPSRDLWAGIAPRISRQRDRRIRAPWIAAASLAASMVLGLGLMLRPSQDAAPAVAAAASPAHAPLRPSAEVLAATLGSEASSRDGNGELRRAAYRPISSETRALVRANLKIVKNAESQLKRALADDPEDAAYLESLLDAAREQKGELRAALEQP